MSDAAPETGFLTAISGAVGAGLGAFGLWLANRMLGKAAIEKAVAEGFASLTDKLHRDNEILRAQLADAEAKVDDMRATMEARLDGEHRNRLQMQRSFVEILHRNGISVPDRLVERE